ncbi:teosinte branched [Striga asiatica]|uniref:Teosinte branched n=1 Tax=Striga asiatica TaxID=4170 RepID=A0A5A7RJF9_STRAF|nr:teosinte branched [Striga asiatica]
MLTPFYYLPHSLYCTIWKCSSRINGSEKHRGSIKSEPLALNDDGNADPQGLRARPETNCSPKWDALFSEHGEFGDDPSSEIRSSKKEQELHPPPDTGGLVGLLLVSDRLLIRRYREWQLRGERLPRRNSVRPSSGSSGDYAGCVARCRDSRELREREN